MTIYPNEIDSDLELPKAEAEVSEISGEHINSLREAVIAIEKTVGENPQGNKSSLGARIDVSIDKDGNIKAEALDEVGLVSLPITNAHVGPTAGIEEYKLDLDYSTQSLKNSINSLRADLSGNQAGLGSVMTALASHTSGLTPNHDGYQIKINLGQQFGVCGLDAATVGAAINEISANLFGGIEGIDPHFETGVEGNIRHAAENISVDAADFSVIDRNADNVQSALASMDQRATAFGSAHSDTFHSNGILNEISSGDIINTNGVVILNEEIEYSAGSSVVTFTNLTSLADLAVGNILMVSSLDSPEVEYFQISEVGPIIGAESLGDSNDLAENQISVFHVFSVDSSGTTGPSGSVYKETSISSDFCPLACAVINNTTVVDTIAILDPRSAHVASIGLNGSILKSDDYSLAVRVGLGQGNYRDVFVPHLNMERLSSNQPIFGVDARSVSERINAYVSSVNPFQVSHAPITAFNIGNELVIAHNWVGPEYTLGILDAYEDSNYALGFGEFGANVVGKTIIGNDTNYYHINGKMLSGINDVFSCVAAVSSTNAIMLQNELGEMIEPASAGVYPGSVIHISDDADINLRGSYTVSSTAGSVVELFEEAFMYGTESVNIFVTGSMISCDVFGSVGETEKGILQIYVNENQNAFVKTRATYGAGIGAGFEILSLSPGFPSGEKTVSSSTATEFIDFYIIDDIAGDVVTIKDSFRGSFKLFHPNGIDYAVVRIISGAIVGASPTLRVYPEMNSDESMSLCSAHFNGEIDITHILDTRSFGTVGFDNAKTDFIEACAQRPTAELRTSGVVRGFDLIDVVYEDSETGLPAIPLRGGVAYVGGVRVAVETQKVVLCPTDAEGETISATYIVSINEFGTMSAQTTDLSELLIDGYKASTAFETTLPLYSVQFDARETISIISVTDIRKFVNALDDKIDIIVDQNENNVGNFKTLEGAILYASKYPAKEKLTIKIVNSVEVNSLVYVPNGISICGTMKYGGSSKQQILNKSLSSGNFITLMGDNRLENIEIVCENPGLDGAVVYIGGSNVYINGCYIRFDGDIKEQENDMGIVVGEDAEKNVSITNNKIENVFSGIVSEYGADTILIENNELSNICGIEGAPYAIYVNTLSRAAENINIIKNNISIPSITDSTDLNVICVIKANAIRNINISWNNITHLAGNNVTSGIFVGPQTGYSSTASNLCILNNIIDGVRLAEDEVYGIYVSEVENILIDKNTIKNVGAYVSGRLNVNVINVLAGYVSVAISNNSLVGCSSSNGIFVADQVVGSVSISGNKLASLGESAHYIRGGAANAMICNNTCIGPGSHGIRWNGTNSKIIGNILTAEGALEDYAFSVYGIYVTKNDMDISDNTITKMYYDFGSIGISNGALDRNRIRISNNTVSGSLMSRMIELYGEQHVVGGNKLYNITTSGSGTDAIYLSGVEDSLITGNGVSGAITYGINTDSTAIENTSIANNSITATVAQKSLNLSGTTTTNCFIIGNRLPTDNYIYGDTNVVGVNIGLADEISIHASAGVSACESGITTNQFYHWAFKDGNGYWEVNSEASLSNRCLYFPINGLPNGAKINSVRVQGKLSGTDPGELFAKVLKNSVTGSTVLTDTIGNEVEIITTGEFTNTTTIGEVTVSDEVVDYSSSNYYVLIRHTGTNPATPEDIRIYGITVEFTY